MRQANHLLMRQFTKQTPSTNCVVHIHDYHLWNKLIHKVPTTPITAEYGTTEIAESIYELLNNSKNELNKKIIVLGGHHEGIIIYGENLNSVYLTLKQYL